ncbi:MAG: putative DNA primase/helicase [Candidatus Azotimanducaceae bacterium]|jgi:putative DNA primase/helicase
MLANQPQRSGKSATAGLHQQTHYTSGRALDKWLAWCDDNGVIAVALILHKWVRTNAPHKSHKNKSLAVKLKDDCIHVKDWTCGESHTFFDGKPPTVLKRREQQADQRRSKRLADEQQEVAQQQAARQAAKLWHEATQSPVAGYFAGKGLSKTHGARWHSGLECWLVLVTDVNGNIHTVQKIYNSGKKLYLKDGRSAGGMVLIGSLIKASRILVCEGFATGCTLREQTSFAVVCAFTAGNLLAVCTAIRAAYPAIEVIVCGDDDRRNDGNLGRKKATEAANAVGGKLAMPILCEGCDCSDFNDQANCSNGGSQ